MSLYFSRAVARQPQSLLRRTAFRTQSTTSEAATKAKEAASQVESKATEGLSRVQSSAGNAMSRIGSAAGSAMNAIGGIGGPIGRLVLFVQCKFSFLRWRFSLSTDWTCSLQLWSLLPYTTRESALSWERSSSRDGK